MIAIRTDANREIAMGHVMRCLAIAKQLYAIGEKIIFFTSGNYARDLIEKNGFECYVLKYEYDNKEAELSDFIHILKCKNIEMVLIDSYEVTEIYMKSLKEKFKIVYIDDLNMFKYHADLIINYAYNTKKSLYARWNYDSNMDFLLGSKYIPLRSEFANIPVQCREKVNSIFITTGGADKYNMLLEILHMLLNPCWSQFNKIVIAGKFYDHIIDLKNVEKQEKSVKVYYDVSNIVKIMKKCDIAISAGGTTIAELCACGIPTIAFAVAENQIYGLEAYAKDGIVRYAGDARKDKSGIINNIELYLKDFIYNKKNREQQGRAAHNIIDGNGAMRIARKIMSVKTNKNKATKE